MTSSDTPVDVTVVLRMFGVDGNPIATKDQATRKVSRFDVIEVKGNHEELLSSISVAACNGSAKVAADRAMEEAAIHIANYPPSFVVALDLTGEGPVALH